MTIGLQKIAKLFVALGIVTFLWVSFLGLSHVAMNQHNAEQSACPFMPGHPSMCTMSAMEHLQALQGMFTTLPAQDTLAALFALMALFAVLRLRPLHKHLLSRRLRPESYANPFYLTDVFIPNPLKEAFSSGILNPKTF